MAQQCSLCSLEFKNADQYKQHLEGRKHKKIESIKQEREKTALRSLFVSNLKKDTFQKHLEEHFVQFGKISKIVIDQEKNAYAIIEYEEEESVEKALAATEHKVNNKNLKVSRREIKEFVFKLPQSNDIKKEALEKLKEEALAVNIILGKCETFDEQVEALIRYVKLEDDQLKQRNAICDSMQKILSNYWPEKEFKVCMFGSTLSGLACNGSDMDLTVLFTSYLPDNALKQQKLPNIKPSQLKQRSSNGQDSSDSNMTEIELDEEVNVEKYLDNDQNNDDHPLKISLHTFFTENKHNEFLKFELDHQVKIIARIVQRFYLEAKSIRTITNARCPVVRFLHGKSNTFCDISLNNYLAYENTKLIELYIKLEPNLRKMIYVIRYWMKHKHLYSSNRFNSYTIIWLIIFYIQKSDIGFLPTVDKLAKICHENIEIHGWNCAFETNLTAISSIKRERKSETIDINDFNGLLKGFFEFYASFDFTPNKIISTRDAQVYFNSDITQVSKLAELNVQDPFDLSHNLTANISKNTLEHFISECKSSNDLLQYSRLPRKSQTKGWGLILLMTKKSLPPHTPSQITAKELVEKSMFKLKLVDESALNSDKNNNQEMTVHKAIEFVLFLFKECLLFEQLTQDQLNENKRKRFKMLTTICDQVDLLGLNCSPKRQKIAQNTSNDPEKPSNTYVCVMDENINNNSSASQDHQTVSSHMFTAKYNTWQGRRSVKREIKSKLNNTSDIQLEKMVSEKLWEANKAKAESNGINFRINFAVDSKSVSQTDNSADLQVKFEMLEETDNQNELINFTTLTHFLDIYINNCHEKFFSQWNQSAKASF